MPLDSQRRYIICCICVRERLWNGLRIPSLPGTIFMRVPNRRWEENEMAHFLATHQLWRKPCILLFYPLLNGASQLLDIRARQPMIFIDNGDGYEWATLCFRRVSGWHAGSACHCSATWPVSSRYQPGDTATVTVKVVAANAVQVFFKPSSRKTQADTYIPPVRKWVLAEDVKKHKTVPLTKGWCSTLLLLLPAYNIYCNHERE